ncbi:MAG: ligase-associated DNA damage response endonuclease PdeM [Burkholderiaceae bacterium]
MSSVDQTLHQPVQWAGESLWLLPDKAVFWPARRLLLIADPHLGKASTFRQAGLPVPAGTTAANLARLDALIERLAPAGIVVLGDLLHARVGRTPRLLERMTAWRERHAAIAMRLVRGNHDSHAGDPPPTWRVEVVDEPWDIGPFALCHVARPLPGRFAIGGHVHPVCRLNGPARDSLRLPCFVADPGVAILPAFGEFTGGALIDAAPGRRRYAIGGGRVWPLAANPGD